MAIPPKRQTKTVYILVCILASTSIAMVGEVGSKRKWHRVDRLSWAKGRMREQIGRMKSACRPYCSNITLEAVKDSVQTGMQISSNRHRHGGRGGEQEEITSWRPFLLDEM
jgi:hypothetical protein